MEKDKILAIGIIVGFIGMFFAGFFSTFRILAPIINHMSEENAELADEYNQLQSNYSSLKENYDSLFTDYKNLKEAFERPLNSFEVPTIAELENWLNSDNTNSYKYKEDVWMCGDYATMLMTRAKKENWRMRIACMYFSFEGDPGYGDTNDDYGSYGHAFNMILCQDGEDDGSELDIYFIEPQSDGVWSIFNTTAEHINFKPETYYDFSGASMGSIWDGEMFWTNHYSYFG